ncbi:hypothetical protein LZK77_04425 [Rhizobium leguminosarum]|nr:hypothetical protein LZK77_04425 [Rhizobium leguminosarum]
MFEIVGDDIAQLNDTDLRALIGLLCEAEMHRQALPVTAVTWGGSQNAGDGGLDVRVEVPAGGTISGIIPSPSTGFQVKKTRHAGCCHCKGNEAGRRAASRVS